MEPTKPKTRLISTDTLQAILVSLVITLVIYMFIAMPNQVLSVSMQPTFYEGDYIITEKTITWLNKLGFNYDYQRGDIVVFQQPYKLDLIKRIIGMPGDRIRITEGKVYINDNLLNEPYLNSALFTKPGSFLEENKTVEIPKDSYIMMGDNRPSSLDSRYSEVGLVEKQYIKGKVIFRYLPLNKLGSVYN